MRALACAALLALCACGKSEVTASSGDWPAFDQPQSPTPQAVAKKALPQACALVSAEQAQALLQQPVSLMSEDPENCLYASAGNPGQITMLMVALVQNDDVAMAQTVFNALTGLQGKLSSTVNAQLGEKTKKSGQELEDLGDEAWLSASNMDLIGSKQLVARQGAVIFHLNITGMTKGQGLDQGLDARLTALARTAVPQL